MKTKLSHQISHLFYFYHFQRSPSDFKEIWQVCYHKISSHISLSFYLEEFQETKTFASTVCRTSPRILLRLDPRLKRRSEGSCRNSNDKRTALRGPQHKSQPPIAAESHYRFLPRLIPGAACPPGPPARRRGGPQADSRYVETTHKAQSAGPAGRGRRGAA